MPPFLQGRKTRAGGGGGKARHITRGTELDRLVERFISRLTDRGSEGPAPEIDEIEDGPRFWTRNMPEWALAEDPAADALAAHAYGWESDVALAEERLERELRRGNLEPIGGEALAVRSAQERAPAALAPPRAAGGSLEREELEVVRFRAYIEMRDGEESRTRRRGRGRAVTGCEMVFSFDRPMTNGDIRALTDEFLERPMKVVLNRVRGPELVTNPLRDLPAGAAVHGGGGHVHLLFDNRDERGAAVRLAPQVWRSFDVHWARIWSEYERDPELFREHVQKKEQTEVWKRDARERRGWGLPPAPKPERVADLFDQRALRMKSQIVTDLKTAGLDPARFRIVERSVSRSDNAFGRLAARLELAEERFRHALATGAPLETARGRSNEMERLAGEAERSRKARRRAGKRGEPAPLRTDREADELARLRAGRAEAAFDDVKTALLLGNYEYLKAKARISGDKGARLAGGASAEVGRDELRCSVIARAVVEAAEIRSGVGRGMPVARYRMEVYLALDELGHRERDAEVTRLLREQCRGFRLAPERVRATAEVERGREFVAQALLMRAEEALRAAVEESERGGARSEAERARLRAAVLTQEREFARLREYLQERRAGVDECLNALGAGRHEVPTRFADGELTALTAGLPADEKRDELLAALTRGETERREGERLWRAAEAGVGATAGPQPPGTFRVVESDPRARAGLLMGEYIVRRARFLELYNTGRPHAEAQREADRAGREAGEAIAQHRSEYDAAPVVILSGAQYDYVDRVSRNFSSYELSNLRKEAQGALVVGRSSERRSVDVPAAPVRQQPSAGPERSRTGPDRQRLGGSSGRGGR